MEMFEGDLLVDEGPKRREATKKRKEYKEISVKKEEVLSYEEKGYEPFKELKLKTKLRKPLSPDHKLENRTWLLFFLLGYPELSKNRNFKIKIERKGTPVTYKQIDVFAKDEETVIVAECKAQQKIRRRSLQKDIDEFANLKGDLARSIKKHYGPAFKPKIIWLFVTENIIWSKPDRLRAETQNIHIVTERELRYYLQIANHLKSAARYQFLAEFLKGQKIPGLDGKYVPAIRGKLGGRTFYAFVSNPEQLLKIAFVNHRSLNDPEGAPAYQRLMTKTRLKQISEFVSAGGFFPTNVLINFNEKVRFDLKESDKDAGISWGHLYMPPKYRSAWVIDGQHRLYGYAPLQDKRKTANLFVTINHEQKTVPKTLLDDLEGELKWGSDKPTERLGAICARLITVLNEDIGEPFHARVTRQGIPATDRTCLTVPGLKEGLKRSGLLGSVTLKNRVYELGPLCGASDEETVQRAREAINLFFSQLKSSNLKLWDSGREGLFCTNTGIHAYCLLLGELIDYMSADKGMDPKELSPQELVSEIEEYLVPIADWLEAADGSAMEGKFRVQYGSGGPREYFFRLAELIQERYQDFEPEGMTEWREEKSEDNVRRADEQLKEINRVVQHALFAKLKKQYGNDYWEDGVTDRDIKTQAYSKSMEDDKNVRLDLEHYLDFIQYKKIAEKKHVWPFVKDLFDIPEPGEKGLSKNVKWMEQINKLRRIPAHSTVGRTYRLDDIRYIDFIYQELQHRIPEEFWE